MAEYRRRKRPLNAPHHSENLQVSLLRMASGDACYCCDHHDRPRTRPLAQQFMDRAICRYLHLGLPLRQAGSSCSHEGGCGKKRGDDRVKVQSLISPLALWRGQRAAPPLDINEPDVQSTSQEVCNKPSPHMPSSLKRSSSRRIIFKVSASKKITSVIDSLRVRAIATPPRHYISADHHPHHGIR